MPDSLSVNTFLLPLASLGVLAYTHWWWSILKHWIPTDLTHPKSTPPSAQPLSNQTENNPPVSTIIPFRNEAQRIPRLLNSLGKIQAPPSWEIIFCNDHSNDNTVNIIQHFIETHPQLNAKILTLSESEQGKKWALSAGIAAAQHEIIHTTDADCGLQPEIYLHLLQHIQQPHVHLVLGRVEFLTQFTMRHSNAVESNQTFTPVAQKTVRNFPNQLLQNYQLIENSVLIALGYTELLKNNPAAANGANLMFKKSRFLQLGGYQGNMQHASGDDVFTLEKFLLNNPQSVAFCKHPQAAVITEVENNFIDFKNQRIRWMKKSFLQKSQKTARKQTFMGLSLFGLWVIAAVSVFSAHYETMALLWLGKLCVDAACVSILLRDHPQKPSVLNILFCSILQILWLPTLGLLSANKKFLWKGRAHNA